MQPTSRSSRFSQSPPKTKEKLPTTQHNTQSGLRTALQTALPSPHLRAENQIIQKSSSSSSDPPTHTHTHTHKQTLSLSVVTLSQFLQRQHTPTKHTENQLLSSTFSSSSSHPLVVLSNLLSTVCMLFHPHHRHKTPHSPLPPLCLEPKRFYQIHNHLSQTLASKPKIEQPKNQTPIIHKNTHTNSLSLSLSLSQQTAFCVFVFRIPKALRFRTTF